ncbi:MAG: hypothetical protein QNJ65_11825 [Xenococcaceae cyanobacterium MO_234.B1]|nr:hypothetical protein [Xenococcaceae cyanobacterium MO_234.B1]
MWRLLNQGKDDGLRTSWFGGNSYFPIGWDWVKAALLNSWKLLNSVVFTGNEDPNPAMASLKQHQQRLYQLEFKVLTYSYAVS